MFQYCFSRLPVIQTAIPLNIIFKKRQRQSIILLYKNNRLSTETDSIDHKRQNVVLTIWMYHWKSESTQGVREEDKHVPFHR